MSIIIFVQTPFKSKLITLCKFFHSFINYVNGNYLLSVKGNFKWFDLILKKLQIL